MGFNGSHLGPTLRAKRGERVAVRVRNALDEASSVHWHGMHLPAAMDGGPHQTVAAGSTWTPRWTVDQPAATLWYHPHPHGATERHVRRGPAGMFLLDDEDSERLKLPKTYGVDDLPVMVQDVTFDGAEFDHGHRFLANSGFLGERTMVNGTLDPYAEVRDERVRLRLLNASTARIYTFGFADDRPFALVGTDGGLLPEPASMDRVQLSPGERAEIVVTVRPGERTVLRSYPWRQGNGWERRFDGVTTPSTSSSCGRPNGCAPPPRCRPGWRRTRVWGCRRPGTRCAPATSNCAGRGSTGGRWRWTGSTRRSPGGRRRCGRCATAAT